VKGKSIVFMEGISAGYESRSMTPNVIPSEAAAAAESRDNALKGKGPRRDMTAALIPRPRQIQMVPAVRHPRQQVGRIGQKHHPFPIRADHRGRTEPIADHPIRGARQQDGRPLAAARRSRTQARIPQEHRLRRIGSAGDEIGGQRIHAAHPPSKANHKARNIEKPTAPGFPAFFNADIRNSVP
jgi:hypothetical protein